MSGNTATEIGSYRMTVTAKSDANNFVGETSVSYTVMSASPTIDVEPQAIRGLVYSGIPLALVSEGRSDDGAMMYRLDDADAWTAEVPQATDAGTYTVYYMAAGAGARQDSTIGSVQVSIEAASITAATVSGLVDATYTGAAITPVPKVSIGLTTLVPELDYTLRYTNNVNAGTALVVATGTGNYQGTALGTFSIKARSLADATVSGVNDAYYTGAEITQPDLAVTQQGTELVPGTDYTVLYTGNTKVGTASVVIMGASNYTGTVIKTFEISKQANPVKAKAKKVTVKYTKVRKKAQGVKRAKAFTVSGAQGKLTFKIAKYTTKKAKGKISITKAGKVRVKKGTKRGTYKVKVAVTAAGNAQYLPGTKSVTLKVVVK